MEIKDPIHYLSQVEIEEEKSDLQPGWYFWNEIWADRIGPFNTEVLARDKLRQYAKTL
jgi:hypothetical protein